MSLPPLSAEQRAAARDKATAARRTRAMLKDRLKRNGVSLPEVLSAGDTDEVVGKMRVAELIE